MESRLLMFVGFCAIAAAAVVATVTGIVPDLGGLAGAFVMFIGGCTIAAASIAMAGKALFSACRYFGRATRAVRAEVDLEAAVREWKQRHPARAKRYSDEWN